MNKIIINTYKNRKVKYKEEIKWQKEVDSQEEWEGFTAWLKTSSFLDSERTRKLHRLILSSAHELAIDGAGRILLPGVLREYAALEQDVVVNGVNDHAEIWDRARWAEYWSTGLEMLPELTGGRVTP